MTNQALLDKILLDAKTEADNIISIATQQGEEMVRLATQKASEEEKQMLTRMQTESASIFTRRETVARIDVAKIIGRAKLEAIDNCYLKALDKLCSLSSEDMTKVLVNILAKYAKPKDSIRFSTAIDESLAKSILSHPTLSHLSLTLLDTKGTFRGGVVIVSAEYDTTITFEILLKLHRDKHEAEILNKLI